MDAVKSPHFLGSNMFLRGYDCKEVAGSHEEEECRGPVLVHWQVGKVVLLRHAWCCVTRGVASHVVLRHMLIFITSLRHVYLLHIVYWCQYSIIIETIEKAAQIVNN